MEDKGNNLQNTETTPPKNWQEISEWMQSLADYEDENLEKFAKAIKVTTDENSFASFRIGTLTGLLTFGVKWEKFSSYFQSIDVATEMIDLLLEQKQKSEDRSIRILDLLFSTAGSNLRLSNVRDSSTSFSQDDWHILMEELRDENSIFLSDAEMDKLRESPRDVDSKKRPARFVVASFFDGSRGVKQSVGDLKNSIELYKKSMS